MSFLYAYRAVHRSSLSVLYTRTVGNKSGETDLTAAAGILQIEDELTSLLYSSPIGRKMQCGALLSEKFATACSLWLHVRHVDHR